MTTSSDARLAARAVTPLRLSLACSPAVAAALASRTEHLLAWPDTVRWEVLDGDQADPDLRDALIPPVALHTRCLADAVLLASWRRAVGQVAVIARDHAQAEPAWAVIVPA